MRVKACLVGAAMLLPVIAAAQNPVSDALRNNNARYGKILTAALETFPADKFGYKPTEVQMTVGAIAAHLAEGNDELCGTLSGTTAPKRTPVAATASKDALMARLKETWQFCDEALAKVDDSKLADPMSVFGMKMTRASLMMVTVGDWADHYSQLANYLRLNNLLPPTAKRPPAKQGSR